VAVGKGLGNLAIEIDNETVISKEFYCVNLNFKLWDNEPPTDPDNSVTDASGIDLSSVVVKLNGTTIPSNRFTILDVTQDGNHGKRLIWKVFDDDNLIIGTNTVQVYAKDNAGNELDPYPWSFTFECNR
jgi:hypothetical protein